MFDYATLIALGSLTGILFGTVIIILLFGLLVLSLIGNIFLYWYCKSLIEKLYSLSDSITILLLEIVKFGDHLSSVHELEMFYGDEVLTGLIKHSKSLLETFKDFEETHKLFDLEEIDYYEDAEEAEEVLFDANAEAQKES